MMIQKSAVEKVESFIRQINDLDVVVDKSAREIIITEGEDSEEFTDHPYLTEVLHFFWSKYLKYGTDEPMKGHWAQKFAYWIDHAYLLGVIKQGDGAIKKIREYTEENNSLKSSIETIAEENLKLNLEVATLKGQLTECEKLHGLFAKKDA